MNPQKNVRNKNTISFDCIYLRCGSTMYIPEITQLHTKKIKLKIKKEKIVMLDTYQFNQILFVVGESE